MEPDAYEETRHLFREAFDVDIEDKEEVRNLAADHRWLRNQREARERNEKRIGAFLLTCIAAAITALFGNLDALWRFFHGR